MHSKCSLLTFEKEANPWAFACLLALHEEERPEYRHSSVSTPAGVGGGSGGWQGQQWHPSSAHPGHPSSETGWKCWNVQGVQRRLDSGGETCLHFRGSTGKVAWSRNTLGPSAYSLSRFGQGLHNCIATQQLRELVPEGATAALSSQPGQGTWPHPPCCDPWGLFLLFTHGKWAAGKKQKHSAWEDGFCFEFFSLITTIMVQINFLIHFRWESWATT